MANKTIAALFALVLVACDQPDVARLLEDFMYEKPVLVMLAPTPDDARMIAQHKTITALKENNFAVIEVIANQSVRLDGRQLVQMGTPAFYDYFEAKEVDFTVIFISLSGNELARSLAPLSEAELTVFLER